MHSEIAETPNISTHRHTQSVAGSRSWGWLQGAHLAARALVRHEVIAQPLKIARWLLHCSTTCSAHSSKAITCSRVIWSKCIQCQMIRSFRINGGEARDEAQDKKSPTDLKQAPRVAYCLAACRSGSPRGAHTTSTKRKSITEATGKCSYSCVLAAGGSRLKGNWFFEVSGTGQDLTHRDQSMHTKKWEGKGKVT